jgi:hypothetical protein
VDATYNLEACRAANACGRRVRGFSGTRHRRSDDDRVGQRPPSHAQRPPRIGRGLDMKLRKRVLERPLERPNHVRVIVDREDGHLHGGSYDRYFATSERIIDLGQSLAGRPDATKATLVDSTVLQLDLTLAPMVATFDSIELFSMRAA